MDLVAYVDNVNDDFVDIEMGIRICQFWEARLSFLFGWNESNGYWLDNKEN